MYSIGRIPEEIEYKFATLRKIAHELSKSRSDTATGEGESVSDEELRKFFREDLAQIGEEVEVNVRELILKYCKLFNLTCVETSDIVPASTLPIYDSAKNRFEGLMQFNPSVVQYLYNKYLKDIIKLEEFVEDVVEHEFKHVEFMNRLLSECGLDFVKDESKRFARHIVSDTWIYKTQSKEKRRVENEVKVLCRENVEKYVDEFFKKVKEIFREFREQAQTMVEKQFTEYATTIVPALLTCSIIDRERRSEYMEKLSKFMALPKEKIEKLIDKLDKLLEKEDLCGAINYVEKFLTENARNIELPPDIVVMG